MATAEKCDVSMTSEQCGLQMQAHLAEYTTLTNRITYWISLQYAVYGFAAASLGFIAAALGHLDALYQAWACMLILLFLLWALLQTNFEIYAIVVYLELSLKDRLAKVLGDPSFWGWENYMLKLRESRFVSFEQKLGLFPVFAIGIGAAGLLIVRDLYSNWKTHWRPSAAWLGCCIYVGIMTFLKWRAVSRLQDEVRDNASGNLQMT